MIQRSESTIENVFPEKPSKSVLQQQLEADRAEAESPVAKVKGLIEENPSKAIMIGLGVGIGTGLLVGAVLQSSAPSSWNRESALSEKLSANIKSTLSETIPDFLKKHLPDGIRS